MSRNFYIVGITPIGGNMPSLWSVDGGPRTLGARTSHGGRLAPAALSLLICWCEIPYLRPGLRLDSGRDTFAVTSSLTLVTLLELPLSLRRQNSGILTGRAKAVPMKARENGRYRPTTEGGTAETG